MAENSRARATSAAAHVWNPRNGGGARRRGADAGTGRDCRWVLRKANNAMATSVNRGPMISKTTQMGSTDRLEYAMSSMQGYRASMEDAHAFFGDLGDSAATSFFGVYDGHGGPAVSKYCATHFHLEVLNHPEFSGNLPNALERAFFRMDEMLRNEEARRELTEYGPKDYCKVTAKDMLLSCACLKKYQGPLDEGSTVCVLLLRGNEIIVGNAGDCRCVLSRNGLVQ